MEPDAERRTIQRRDDDTWHREHTALIEGKLDRTDKVLKIIAAIGALFAMAVAGLVLYLNTKYEPFGSVAAVSKEQTAIYGALSKSQNESKSAFDQLSWKVDQLVQSKALDNANTSKMQDTLSQLNLTLAGLKAQLDQTSKNADRIEEHEKRLGRLEAKSGITP